VPAEALLVRLLSFSSKLPSSPPSSLPLWLPRLGESGATADRLAVPPMHPPFAVLLFAQAEAHGAA
jgi:hypothetical protein